MFRLHDLAFVAAVRASKTDSRRISPAEVHLWAKISVSTSANGTIGFACDEWSESCQKQSKQRAISCSIIGKITNQRAQVFGGQGSTILTGPSTGSTRSPMVSEAMRSRCG